MKISQALEAGNYAIDSGSEYLWNCFGPNAYAIDLAIPETEFYATIVFSRVDQTVYEITWDDVKKGPMRWLNPSVIDAFVAECTERNIDWQEAYDGIPYTELRSEQIALTELTISYNTAKEQQNVASN